MSGRPKSTAVDAIRHDELPDGMSEPQIDPIDDALWHLQIEARRLAQFVQKHELNAAQRRDLERSLAVLRTAIEWQPARKRSTAEAEPAL
jgi:hypothetical protein